MYSSLWHLIVLRIASTARLLRNGSLVLVLALALLAVSPTTQALSPPPDGGYPNGNTAEGDSALANITMGFENTAIGFQALSTDTIGFRNTAVGSDALSNSTVGSINTAIGTTALFNN